MFIYDLIEPDTKEIRYVGKTVNLTQRLRKHLYMAEKENNHRAAWIKSLKAKGLKPEMCNVIEVSGNGNQAEMERIALYQSYGIDLVNSTVGGDGPLGFRHTEEAKKRIGQASTGNTYRLGSKHSEEWKKSNSERMKGNKFNLGRVRSEEERKVISQNSKGNKGRKGQPLSDEHKRKVSESMKGHKMSEETKMKISNSLKKTLNLGKAV